MPGDSFPATGQQLVASSLMAPSSSLDKLNLDIDPSDEDLLRRLQQSQARMEQIKRMLVNQRGFIVQALKQLAENTQKINNNSSSKSDCQCAETQVIDLEEKDRTLGGTYKYSASVIKEDKKDCEDKLCPMCEAAFPQDVDEETFESHVVEHFCFEEAETIKYVPCLEEEEIQNMQTKNTQM